MIWAIYILDLATIRKNYNWPYFLYIIRDEFL